MGLDFFFLQIKYHSILSVMVFKHFALKCLLMGIVSRLSNVTYRSFVSNVLRITSVIRIFSRFVILFMLISHICVLITMSLDKIYMYRVFTSTYLLVLHSVRKEFCIYIMMTPMQDWTDLDWLVQEILVSVTHR